MLADRELDFPFCLCWANENWSRRWDGSEHDILMEQEYQPDDPAGLSAMLRIFCATRATSPCDGSPILLVYRPAVIPDVREMLRTWRATAADVGLTDLHLCAVQSNDYTSGLEDGFDAMVEFPPHSIPVGEITRTVPEVASDFSGKIFSYADVVRYSPPRWSRASACRYTAAS